jgi:hypothetical protein
VYCGDKYVIDPPSRHTNKPITMEYEIISSRPDGFFSNVFSVIGGLHWCASQGKTPAVLFNSGPYLDKERGPNWWEYYFEPVSQLNPLTLSAPDEPARSVAQASLFCSIACHDLCKAADIYRKNIVVRPEISAEVEALWRERLAGFFVMGIHLRGTDKWIEGHNYPELEKVFTHLDAVIAGRPKDTWRIFLATDETHFLEALRERYGHQLVFLDATRSDNHLPLHRPTTTQEWSQSPWRDQALPQSPQTSPYQLGREALLDALLLSRCQVFFGCMSNLSFFVRVSSPAIPAICLTGDWMKKPRHVDIVSGKTYPSPEPELTGSPAEFYEKIANHRLDEIRYLRGAAEHFRQAMEARPLPAAAGYVQELEKACRERLAAIESLDAEVRRLREKLAKHASKAARKD